MVDQDQFVDLISMLTSYVQNERVRAFNEGLDEERERCARIAENMGRSGGRVKASHKHVAAQIRSGNSRILPINKM